MTVITKVCLFFIALSITGNENANAQVPQQSFAPIIKKIKEAVVHIQVTRESNFVNPFASDPFFQFFFGREFNVPSKVKERAAGSGNIVSSDGYVLTCAHVVGGENYSRDGKSYDISVKLINGKEYPAKVIYVDNDNDLALLKIEAQGKSDFTYLPIGDSDKSEVGDIVIAVGYPFGIRQTVTSGIISSIDQPFRDKTVLQTDAAVNPGNSGGALINLNGELVGVPNAILSRSGGFHGIGFAIPSLTFKKLVTTKGDPEALKEAWHGIFVRVAQTKIKDENPHAYEENEDGPITVVELHEKSPAKEAGLKPADIITSAQGKDLSSIHEFNTRLSALSAGDEVTLAVLRDNEKKDIIFKLTEKPKSQGVYTAEKGPLKGMTFQNKGDALKEQGKDLQNDSEGVVVIEVPREKMGRPFITGDFIIRLNDKKIKNIENLKDLEDSQIQSFTLQRGNLTIQSSTSGSRMLG